MDKKKKAQFKNIEKELIKRLKSVSKTFKYKTISNSLYKKSDGFFLHSVYFATYMDSSLKFTIWNYVKTYKSDELFWTIFDMKSNIDERDSLRADGAYTMPSYKHSEYSLEITEPVDLEELCMDFMKKTSMEHDDFIESLNRNTEKFNRYLLEQSGYLREELIKMIASMEIGDFRNAKEMAEHEIFEGNRGGYCCGDKDIYQYVLEYCKNKM